MGEALLSHPRACHILSVERKNKHPQFSVKKKTSLVFFLCQVKCADMFANGFQQKCR